MRPAITALFSVAVFSSPFLSLPPLPSSFSPFALLSSLLPLLVWLLSDMHHDMLMTC